MKPGGTFIAALASDWAAWKVTFLPNTTGVVTHNLFSGSSESISALIFLITVYQAMPTEQKLSAK